MAEVKLYEIDKKIHEIILAKGGKVLNIYNKNKRNVLEVKCKNGHIFKTQSYYFKKSWCKKCFVESSKLGIESLVKFSEDYNLKFCIDKYERNNQKILWCCTNGHLWEKRFSDIKKQTNSNTKCPECRKSEKIKLAELNIKEKIKNNKCKECNIFIDIKKVKNRKNFCLNCLLIERLKTKGYFLIAGDYNSKKIFVECVGGSRYYIDRKKLLKKRHCSCDLCAKSKRRDIEDAISLAKFRGGECISSGNINSNSRIKWRCKFGHEWESKFCQNLRGSWCPHCNDGLYEKITRIIFEHKFNKKFIKTKPAWLINGDGNQMELDGYCAELNIAFEFHGRQHYEKTFNHDNFERRKILDKEKRNLCKANNVKLYEIYGESVKNVIANIAKEFNYNKKDINKIDLGEVYKSNKLYEQNLRLQNFVQSKGAQIIDGTYLTNKTVFTIKCNCGNIFKSSFSNIMRKSGKGNVWCRKC